VKVVAGAIVVVAVGLVLFTGPLPTDQAGAPQQPSEDGPPAVVSTVPPTSTVVDRFSQLLPDLRARAFFEMVPPTDGRSVVALTAQQIDAIKGGFKFAYRAEKGIAILDTADGMVGIAQSLGRPDLVMPPPGVVRVLPDVLVSPDGTYSVVPGEGARPPVLYNTITGATRNLDPRVGINSAIWSPDSTMLAVLDTRFDRILIEFIDGSMGVIALDLLGVRPVDESSLVIYR